MLKGVRGFASEGSQIYTKYSQHRQSHLNDLGRTPQGAYSSRGRSRHILECAFSEPILRTLLRTLFYWKTHSRPPSQNPSENPFPRTLPRTFSEPCSERCVAVRPLRRAPYFSKGPKSVKNCLNNSQNHFRSVNITSVILTFTHYNDSRSIIYRKTNSGRVKVGNLLPDELLK